MPTTCRITRRLRTAGALLSSPRRAAAGGAPAPPQAVWGGASIWWPIARVPHPTPFRTRP